MFRAITILKLDETGLTLKARFMNGAVQNGAWVTTGFLELGNAEYEWDCSVFPTNFQGRVEIWNDETYITSLAINPQEFEFNDQRVSEVEVTTTQRKLQINHRELRTS